MNNHADYTAYSAIVGLEPRAEIPEFAYALAKFSYRVTPQGLLPHAAEPLLFDVWKDEPLQPRLPIGSDFWFKPACDVVIHGDACAPHARPLSTMTVRVRVGSHVKRVAVFGRREISWTDTGRALIGSPEPFTRMPMRATHAYGGLDDRVAIPSDLLETYTAMLEGGMIADHPGLYPRNPFGKGYLALPGPMSGLELPNLEDPDDLLTADRLHPSAPDRWDQQPLPWHLDWCHPTSFPRSLYFGVDAWFERPDDEQLTEIRRGFLPKGIKARLWDEPELAEYGYQEASYGMCFTTPLAGQLLRIDGMTEDALPVEFTIPSEPRVEIDVEGHVEAIQPTLTNLVVHTDERLVTLTYYARTQSLPRVFIPGIHKQIPLSARINGCLPIAYSAPEPIYERIERANNVAAAVSHAASRKP